MFGRRRFWRRSMDADDCKKQQSNGLNDDIDDENLLIETHFVRALNCFFRVWGKAIARHPWLFIVSSTLLTIFCTLRIPFTPLSNDVADFTPYGARARQEIEAYEAFFSKKGGEPVVLFVLLTAKNERGNMLNIDELGAAVQLLNIINEQFKVWDSVSNRNLSFIDFCDNFCTINEPVRHFHSGLLLERNFGNSSLEHIDLGYPISTILGRQIHMDPHFFGVKIAVEQHSSNGTSSSMEEMIISVNELRTLSTNTDQQNAVIFESASSQIPNNIRAISLVGLHFRAVRPQGVSKQQLQDWQRKIAKFVSHEFNSTFVNAFVLTETLLTDEVVRSGLSLLPFLLIGFIIMVTFSSITISIAAFYMGQMGIHKILLAFVACSCPFMACGTAMGGMFWLGFRFGSLLCVTPFLVLALGVDDAYLMLNSWQRLRQKMEKGRQKEKKVKEEDEPSNLLVQKLMAEVMVDTGASITITTLTNVLAFSIGAATPTPEIRLFSIGNAVAITIVYIYQWTIFGSAMALFGCHEFQQRKKTPRNHLPIECHHPNSPPSPPLNSPVDDAHSSGSSSSEADSGIIRGSFTSVSRASSRNSSEDSKGVGDKFRWVVHKLGTKLLHFYCRALANCWVALGVLALLAAYLYTSFYGLLTIRAELKPEQLFLHSSDVQQILRLRNEFIMPFYAVCLVFVARPGNFSDPAQRRRLHSLVEEFEALPSSVGRFSTKFWLRDYEQFVAAASADEAAPLDLATFEGISADERHKNELAEFLEWPEFQFWNGFVQLEKGTNGSKMEGEEPKLSRFFFSTASFGAELKEWSKREQLLGQWRRVADSFPELQVTVYEDEAKFLDLIPTMIPQTLQSAFCTLICMFLVCLLFMTNAGSLLVSNFAIFSTCIGVFGIQSLMGTALDPIFMSAAIMSIGFSVDIPAHIAYHYYKTGVQDEMSVDERLRDCLSAIAFPVLEAGLSTLICTSSLFFVNLHMARVFAVTMSLVVAIGLLHGLLVIPAMLCQISTLSPTYQRRKNMAAKSLQSSSAVQPIVLAVNQHDKF